MRIKLRNSNALFVNKSSIKEEVRVGFNSRGIVLNSYLDGKGIAIQMETDVNYCVSPYIPIEGIIGDITITNVRVPASGQSVLSFYSNSNEKDFISNIVGTKGNVSSTTIPFSDIPTNAKFVRFTAAYAKIYDSFSANASMFSFLKVNDYL